MPERVDDLVFDAPVDAARMAQDYLQVYRQLVHAGLERVRSATPASKLLALAPRKAEWGRTARSQAPLLGILPCAE